MSVRYELFVDVPLLEGEMGVPSLAGAAGGTRATVGTMEKGNSRTQSGTSRNKLGEIRDPD